MAKKPTYEELEQRVKELEEDNLKKKSVEVALRENEEKWRLLTENSPDHIMLLDLDYNIQLINHTVPDLTIEEVIGRSIMNFSPLDQHQMAIDCFESVIQSGKPDRYETQYINVEGKKHYFDVRVSPVMGKDGRVAGLISSSNNVTDRKRAEEALRESEIKHKTLVQNIPGMVYRGRSDWSAEIISGSEEICGYTDQELNSTEKNWLSIIHADDKEGVFKEGSELVYDPKDLVQTYRIITKEGSIRWVEDHKTSLFSEKGEFIGIEGIVLNTTERKRAEEEKEKLEARFMQVQKMEAIGTLSGGIAHDFNNILGIIVGNTEIAMMDVPEWSPARDNLEKIRKACIRSRDLVRQILAFSRMSIKELNPLRLSLIIKESLKLLRSSIPTTIEIRQNISAESDSINADPTQINQIFLNLCTNATHAMREKGGILEVSLESVELDDKAVAQFHDLTPGRYVGLTVSDTGHGIEPGIMERIFDPYFTTKEVGEGSGMGLAVVHGIIKNHGGAISVKSEPGEGATFYVFFPISEIEAEGELETIESLPKGNERILFVDDEKAMVDAVQPMLEHLGYKVTAKTSSIEALEAFRDKQNAFDLVITDMTMPNMTGIDLTKELLKIRSDILIILCTGYSEMIDKDKAKKLGISKFSMKPLVLSEIAMAIREVLDKK
ncbi:PAS domain S-box protein [Thermodesulfobacteriota bacterium]